MAGEIKSLQWVVDGLHDTESVAVRELISLAAADLAAASSIVNMDWVQDGIEELEANTIWRMSNVAWKDVGIATSLIGFEWIQDGIDQAEYQAIDELRYFNFDDLRLVSSILAFEWVQDGISQLEAELVDLLNNFGDMPVATQLVGMPFLASVEQADVSAVNAIVIMAHNYSALLEHVLTHPALAGGITDVHTHVIMTLNNRTADNDLADRLLDPNRTTIELRTINLPHTGEIELVIIRHGAGSTRAMDLLEYAVRYMEGIVGAPLPIRHVTILFNTEAIGDYGGAEHRKSHILIAKDFDTDDDSYHSKELSGILAHETAHYYWFYWYGDPAVWIYEGLANTLGGLSEQTRIGEPLAPENTLPCGTVSNISELDALPEDQQDENWLCNYALGERLFFDLYDQLGHEDFRQALGRLYSRVQAKGEGDKLSIQDVTVAFGRQNEAAKEIIAYWYSGAALPE